jgi:4-hydroxy-tetrahydrodipicolinate reductase
MRIAIAGAAGRMGRTLTRIAAESRDIEIAGGLERDGSPHIGADMGELAGIGKNGRQIVNDAAKLFKEVDGILDFTMPEASARMCEAAAEAGIVHVIGTTGFSESEEDRIRRAARGAIVVKSGNMSLGVTLLAALVKKTSEILGEDFDIEILEMHHRQKVDAPSGTALLLGKAAAEGRGRDVKTDSVRVRDGHTGPRRSGSIGFATLRGGSVVGEHRVIFAGPAERIELIHKAESRDIFARGAIRALLWARNKEPGLYSMADVLGLGE